jgi:hypothetical protein
MDHSPVPLAAPEPPPAPVSPIPPGWENILDPDERILWQGQPRDGIEWAGLFDMQTVFGVFFTFFAMAWVNMTSEMTSQMRGAPMVFKLFPLFGLIFAAIGLDMVIGRHLRAAYVRHGTRYTLTSKAVYIATQPLGKRKLQRYGLEQTSVPELTDGTPGSVYFGSRLIAHVNPTGGPRLRQPNRSVLTPLHRTNGLAFNRSTAARQAVGFERIDDARLVYRLLREAQDAHAKATAAA